MNSCIRSWPGSSGLHCWHVWRWCPTCLWTKRRWTGLSGTNWSQLADQIRRDYRAEVVLEDGLIEQIRRRASRTENGARMLESIIEGELLPPVSFALLEKLAAGEDIDRVTLGVSGEGFEGRVDAGKKLTETV